MPRSAAHCRDSSDLGQENIPLKAVHLSTGRCEEVVDRREDSEEGSVLDQTARHNGRQHDADHTQGFDERIAIDIILLEELLQVGKCLRDHPRGSWFHADRGEEARKLDVIRKICNQEDRAYGTQVD